MNNLAFRVIISGFFLGEGRNLAYRITARYNMEKGDVSKLKEYECVEVKHHRDIGKVIAEYQRDGWRLHTYQAAGVDSGPMFTVSHYLLFERDK